MGIINDILDFPKIEAGKLEFEVIEFRLDSVLEQLTDTINLQARGKEVEFLIRNGMKALKQLAQSADKPFDVVLLDWRLPGMNGDEVIRHIHASSAVQLQPKIIMVTAYGREDVMRLANQAGVDSFLIKPVSPSTLLNTILSILGHERVLGSYEKNQEKDLAATVPNFAGSLSCW